MRPQDVFDRIVASHQTIREILASAKTAEPSVVREQFDRLGSILAEHFAYEERPGGFHDRVAEVDAEAARALVDQHRALLVEYAQAIRALDDGLPNGLELARAFARHLGEHERQESEWAGLEVRR